MMGPGVKALSCILLACVCLSVTRAGRERRQISQPIIRQYVVRALAEANAELAQQKALDKLMAEQGICLFKENFMKSK